MGADRNQKELKGVRGPGPIRSAVVLLLLLLVACSGEKEYRIAGRTMGTTYHIKFVGDRSVDAATVQAQVDARLEEINQSMSTYRPDSEISRFNALDEVNRPFEVSVDFWKVMGTARDIYRLTGGAWDGTVDPLVNLWGFGKAGPLEKMPPVAQVERICRQVGFDHIEVGATAVLAKRVADVSVDLASIAKGYGVDRVAALLRALGFANYLVEVGGEVFAAGVRLDGKPWRVGINRPRADAAADEVYKVVALNDRALATSGDYRNFYEIEGRIYSHIIDPRTGYPLQNGVVSATVVADNCTLADGLATAVMIMGPDKGIALIDTLTGVEALIVVRQADGRFADHLSQGMGRLFDE